MLLCLVSSNLFCKQTRIGRGSSQWDGEELPLWVQHKRCLASCHVLIRMETLETSAYDVIIKTPRYQRKNSDCAQKRIHLLCSSLLQFPPVVKSGSWTLLRVTFKVPPMVRQCHESSRWSSPDTMALWYLRVDPMKQPQRSHKRAKVGQSTGFGDGSYGSY